MKLCAHIEKLDRKRYILFLVISATIYFAISHLFQKTLNFQPSIIDTYPGIPLLPEPLELPLYLLGYIVIPLLALGFYQLSIKPTTDKLIKSLVKFKYWLGGFGILIIAYILINRFDLPSADFIINYLQTHSPRHVLWLIFTKRLFIVLVATGLALLSFIVFYFYRQPSVAWLKKFDKSQWLKIISPLFLLLIGLIVFDPNFPAEEGFANYVLFPAFEHIHGKTFLYETVSLYGVLNVYLIILLSKIFLPLTYKGLSFVLFLSYWGFFVGVFYLLKQWLRSTSLAIIGTWFALITSYLMLYDPFRTAYNYLGNSSFRLGFFIIPALLFFWYSRTHKPVLRELLLITSAIAVFWNFDTGIFIALSAWAALAIQRWSRYYHTLKQSWFIKYFKDIFLLGIKQLAYIIIIFAIISIVNLINYGALPQWQLQLEILSIFNVGFGKIPMPLIGTFLIFVLTYVLALVSIVAKLISKQSTDLVFNFITIYGILSFTYYVGNSAWSSLNILMVPLIILWLYAWHRAFYIQGRHVFAKKTTQSAFYALLIFLIVMTAAKLPIVFAGRNYSQTSLYSIPPKDQALHEDAQYINANFPELERIAFFHPDDKLLTYTDKTNLFYVQLDGRRLYSLYDDFLIIYKRQTQGLLEQVAEFKPPYIFVTNSSDARIKDFLNGISQNYSLDTKLNTLDVYKRYD